MRCRKEKLKSKVYLFDFSKWKHSHIINYLSEYDYNNIFFINPIRRANYWKLAIKKGIDEDSIVFVWGTKRFLRLEHFTDKNGIKVIRVEDGFVRSLNLGSDLTTPFSLVFDSQGIYYNSNLPSQLESLLNTHEFSKNDLEKASFFYRQMLQSGVSKYNYYSNHKLMLETTNTKILVVGQVEDDASIYYGARGMTNIKLLLEVRKKNPDSYIIYKPHPDVVSKNRKGALSRVEILRYSDEILEKINIISVIKAVDEVHTMTSLAGLEALLYKKKVVVYGKPFYAGWGLTCDTQFTERRCRKLTLLELIAGVYILYPSYISPLSYSKCSAIDFISDFVLWKSKQSSVFNKIKQYFLIKAKRYRQRVFKFFLSIN